MREIALLGWFLINQMSASDVFHVNSKVTFYPDAVSDYFGYTVLLSDMGLHVGAPKAQTRTSKGAAPGAVFACPVDYLDTSNVTCHPLDRNVRSYVPLDFFQDDMWFGATMTAVPDGKLLVCAPRRTILIQNRYYPIGACYVHGNKWEMPLLPLNDTTRYAVRTDGSRKEYDEYNMVPRTDLVYYVFGQAGMSVAYTKDNNIIMGAPGVLEWTGAVVNYKHTPKTFSFDKQPSTNPYYTKDLGPDAYFGYSVESGIFEANGNVLYVAGAPRGKKGYGQVLIFEPNIHENDPLNIKAKLRGPQLGAYFGSALCTLDIDGDGVSDLLVGAPNFATKSDGEITYDQGTVFVYITRKSEPGFILDDVGIVRGSGKSGARFGTAIADLGDIDGDGFTDVAIGAPWENEETGVVYIYKGGTKGLIAHYIQKIYAKGAKSFGMSITKGYDVDRNKCNDIAVGAHKSSTAYIYRSIPTIQVLSSIKVPDAKNLRRDATNFTALFCVTVPPNRSGLDVRMELRATVTVDPVGNRAFTQGESEYMVTAKSGVDTCDEQIIEVNNQSDLSRPISLTFDLKPKRNIDEQANFPAKGARLSEDSNLHSSFLIQLLSDCGEDLICTPWLEMTLEPLVSSYTPGIESQLGARVRVKNLEEPAYSVKLHLVLPCPPKRLLSTCSLQNLDVICDLPAPLIRNQTAEFKIELEYSWEGTGTELMITANLEDPLYMRQVSDGAKKLVIPITPHSTYNFSGQSQPNATVAVTRETFDKNGDVLFTHYYEITNNGPSDLYNVKIEFLLSEGVVPASPIEGSTQVNNTLVFAPIKLRANGTTAYYLLLRYNLTQYGKLLEENNNILNVTSEMLLHVQYGSNKENRSLNVTTTLTLEPPTPIWPLIVGLVVGLLVLAGIILALYKFGFFSRQKKEELKQLLESKSSQEDPSSLLKPSTADDDDTINEMCDTGLE